MAGEMQALGQDLLEATAHAETMTPEEIEEMIDYLLNEVFYSQSLSRTFPHILDQKQYGKDPVSSHWHLTASVTAPHRSLSRSSPLMLSK